MLACVGQPRTFAEIARYLHRGPYGTAPSPNRVAWTMEHNLPTTDAALAAGIMVATAAQSARTKRAAYHLMIAWHPDEQPTPAEQQEIAARTLALAGLAEHQALIVGHGDTRHAHLHMMINRVHPETGKAWKTSFDYERLDRIMHQLADAHGFRHVPRHAGNPELTDELPTQPTRRAHHAAKRGAATDRPQWSKADARVLGEELSDRVSQASSWEDIEATVSAAGYRIEAKGQGLVVGDDTSYTKFSALGLAATAKDLEKLFGETFKAYRQRRPLVDAVDIARAVGTRDEFARTVQEAVRTREEQLADAPLARQLETDLKRALAASTSLQSAHSQSGHRPAPGQSRSNGCRVTSSTDPVSIASPSSPRHK